METKDDTMQGEVRDGEEKHILYQKYVKSIL